MITIIIPCYRSEAMLEQVVNDIKRQFATQSAHDYKIILVNDCSPDGTFEVIKRLCRENPHIAGLSLTRNFGQQCARMAALPYVEGEYVVFMDDDGQHPADGIFPLIEALEEGHDIAFALFKNKKHSKLKQLGSRINLRMTEWLIGKPKNIRQSAFFAVKSFVAKELQNYKNPSPYLFGYFMQITRNITNVTIEHKERIAGKSGYNFRKLFMLWLDGFVGFSVKPLRFASLLGMIIALSGFIYGIILIFKKIMNPAVAVGYTSMVAILLFIGGLLMLMLGLLGEYIGRMFMSVNQLPQYVVKESINTNRRENNKDIEA